MSSNFEVTPQKEASITSYLHRQVFFTPQPVVGASRLEGKTAIVTGSNCGVGLECSRQLLDLGVTKLILAVRSQARGQAAAEELSRGRDLSAASRSIDVWELDYMSYQSVRDFANRASQNLERIDVVILNAGILPAKQTINPQTGHDEGVQVNYLSMTLLLVLLLDAIRSKPESQPARITITSSDGAAWTKFAERKNKPLLPSLDKPEGWSAIDRQFLSKLLGQFFVAELATRVPSSMAVVNMATPGMVHNSNMNRETKAQLASRIVEPIRRRLGYTSAVAARLIVDAAVNHGVESHGQYLSEQRIKPMAPILYTDEGQELKAQIWGETMAEFVEFDMECLVSGLAQPQDIGVNNATGNK